MGNGDKMRGRPGRLLLAVPLLVVALVAAMWQARPAGAVNTSQGESSPIAEPGAGRVGMLRGAHLDALALESLKGAEDVTYFDTVDEMARALKDGQIDAFAASDACALITVSRVPGLTIAGEPVAESNYCFVFPKGSVHTPEVSNDLAALAADGTLDALKAKWTGADTVKDLPAQDWGATGGVIRMACVTDAEPIAYAGEDGSVTGYDVDLALRICQAHGFGLEIVPMPYDEMLAAVESGAVDMGAGDIPVGEDLQARMDCSIPNYYGSVVLVVADAGAAPAATTTGGDGAAGATDDLELSSVEELFGKKIGIQTGAAYDMLLMEAYDGFDEKSFSYYNNNAELVGALKAKKIDAFITDLPLAGLAINMNDGIGMIEEPLIEDHYGFVLQKGSPLTPLFNQRLEAMRADGTIQAMYDKWVGTDDAVKTMPQQDWDAPNGTITCVTSCDSEPITYLINNKPAGMSVELVELIARDLGYKVDFRVTNATSLIAEVQSGKGDVAAHTFSITEERKQMVDMTEPYFDGGIMAIVRTKEGASKGDKGLIESIKESFVRTFITENRWLLIASGLGVTLLISVCSGVLGLALGFLFVLLRRNDPNGIAEKVISTLENLLGGLPMVVVLMVLYYVVFGAVAIPGSVVAIIAFTLSFGTSSGSTMWNAIRAVDVGQTEAGRALGFSDRDTFLLVVLPQAARQFSHNLLGQFVSLVKDTSIVGYIAVQDLTRAGDLIRARTMEAFFPIIVCAVIYFVLCRLLARGLGRLVARLEPKQGPRAIKGVEL